MTRVPIPMLVTAIAVVAGTWLLGWWTVPLVAAFAGAMLADQSRASVSVALGAGVAWSALLLADASFGRFLALAGLLGHILPLPWPLLIVVTVTYVMLMAWSAAVVGGAIRRAVKPLRAA